MAETPESARISPTAHYTGYVWYRNGLSHPSLATRQGRLLFHGLQPAVRLGARFFTGGLTLETFLLQRHRLLDHLLDAAISDGRVGQVVELAAGYSPRGYHFVRRHPDRLARYVEADLPHVVARKRRLLDRSGLIADRHQLTPVDALASDGPLTLEALFGDLDPDLGVALITEGLLPYFDRATVESLWARFATELGRFPHGLYLSDVYTEEDAYSVPLARAFQRALSVVARGQVHLHYETGAEAEEALSAAGFASVALHDPGDYADRLEIPTAPALVRVGECTV